MGGFREFTNKEANDEAKRIVNLFNKKPSKFENGGIVKAQYGKRFGVKLGNVEHNEFNSETGKYERTAFPKDTIWAYEPITGGERFEAYTTPDGYQGTYTNINGEIDPMYFGDAHRLRDKVEKTLDPESVRQAVIDKNWDETLLPENKVKLDRMRYLIEKFQKNPDAYSQILNAEIYRRIRKKQFK